jgi:hypothetical protein
MLIFLLMQGFGSDVSGQNRPLLPVAAAVRYAGGDGVAIAEARRRTFPSTAVGSTPPLWFRGQKVQYLIGPWDTESNSVE